MYLVHSLELDRHVTRPVPTQDYAARGQASCWIRTSAPAVRAVKEHTLDRMVAVAVDHVPCHSGVLPLTFWHRSFTFKF